MISSDSENLPTLDAAPALVMMQATLESIAGGILVTSAQGRVTAFNENYLRMWKLDRETLVELDHRRLVTTVRELLSDPGQFEARLEEICTLPPSECVDELQFKDGSVVERTCRVQMVNGVSVGRVWSYRDITERRAAYDALRDQTRVLELINETGQIIASTLDLEALLQAVTDASTKLSGAKFGAFFYTAKDERGDTFHLYTLSGAPRSAFEKFGQPRATELFAPTFEGKPPIRSDDVLVDPRYGKMAPHYGMPKGHLAVRSFLSVPVVAHSGEVFGGLFFGHPDPAVFSERTERLVVGLAAQAAIAIDNARLYDQVKRASDERHRLFEFERAAREEAERVSLMKDEFLATLSHELRTPLNAIMGWSQILRLPGTSEEDFRVGLTTIGRSARAQAQLIDDLLDMSRIVLGKIRLDVQRMDLCAVVNAAVDSVHPSAEAKGIRLRRILDPLAGPVAGDPNRLQQVVWNLLANAVKFTPKNGKIDVLLERVNSHLEISVHDSGIGINPDILPHIFERFRQADSSTTRMYGGLGLGLSIVKQLVELHGGKVRAVSSGEGRGSTFVVELPVGPVGDSVNREHPASKAPVSLPFDGFDLTGVRILVVDDEPDGREIIRRVLAQSGAEVWTAAGANEGLEMVESRRPDVIVSDIGMPEKDGYEFIREIRQWPKSRGGRTPAIALTAFARSEDRTRAMIAGYQVHVAKPIEAQELLATVTSLAQALKVSRED